MIFLWNPTNDDLPFQYAGLSYTLKAGKRMKVEEAMGNHVLNSMGPRGMTRLVFNDDGRSIDEEKIAADAIERNKDFKVRQIYIYNEQNEQRKAGGKQYTPPTKIVRQYAAELGIQLLQPYSMAEAEKGEIAKLVEENKALKANFDSLTKQMSELMDALTKPKPQIKGDKVQCPTCKVWMFESTLEEHKEKCKGG